MFGFTDDGRCYELSREEQQYYQAAAASSRPITSARHHRTQAPTYAHAAIARQPSSHPYSGNTFAPPSFTRLRHKCDDCGASFPSLDEFQVHTLTAHHQEEQAAPPPYVGGFHFETQSVDLESAVTRTGQYRGIQGENNSCYLDASLMAMFYANDTFDNLLVRGAGNVDNSAVHTNGEELEYARMYMSLHIVNQVRQRGFVPSGLVVEWRRMINPWFGRGIDFDTHCEEEEAGDFVRFLLERFGNDSIKFVIEPTKTALAKEHARDVIGYEASGEPARAEPSSGNSEVMLQLLAPPNPNGPHGRAWTMSQLLSETLDRQDLLFAELQASLILQLPRYGKRDRVIGDVVPDTTLYAYTSGAYRRKVMYQLKAVVVIGTSHFVSYLRVPKSARGNAPSRHSGGLKDDHSQPEHCTWLYYDSMSDRVNDHNVPLILDVTDELKVLETPNASLLVGQEMAKTGREHLKRVVQDMSMAFYCRVGAQELESTPLWTENGNEWSI